MTSTPVIGIIQARPYSDTECRADVARTRADHAAAIDAFHAAFYRARHTWTLTRFEGYPVMKPPTDLWTYHEWLQVLRPQLVIETGTAFGGSALYFARQLEAWGGRVVSIDNALRDGLPTHRNLQYLDGSSVDPAIVQLCRQVHGEHEMLYGAPAPTSVVLDSNHHRDHVLAELDAYAPLVSVGQLLVVEDTNLQMLGVTADGPDAALAEWLPAHPEFVVEPMCERFLLSFNTWLRRVR